MLEIIKNYYRFVVLFCGGGLLISGLAYVVMGKNFGFENVPITAVVPGFFVGATAAVIISFLIIRSRASLLEYLVAEQKISSELKTEIAQRKEMETALRENEERFSLAMRGANDGLWDWNLKTDDVYYSPRWCQMLGYEQDEVPPTLEGWENLVDPEDKDRVLELVDDYLSGRCENFEIEFRMRHKNGSWVTIWARAFLVKEGAQPVRLVGTHVDISLRKQLEAQVRQAQKMEAIGQITGGVAHDFNNLLNVMLGSAECAQDLLGDNEEAQRHIKEIIAVVDRSASLTQRLLSFSRQQVLTPSTTDVGGLIGGFKDMLRRTLGETVNLTVALGAELWPAKFDAHQFENALLNLAINARDAMPMGGALTIATSNISLDEVYAAKNEDVAPGDYIKITVSDTGTGIEPDVLDKVFDPFFTTKEVGEGSGLGLSMVYGFAKQSEGHITIASEVGHGTRIELFLPRSRDAVAQDVAKEAAPEAFTPRAERILVVEDDTDLRDIPVNLFRKQGFQVVEAKDGTEATKHLREEEAFDLLFTDMVLPGGMNGVEIAEEAQRLQPNIKVLFTTGYAHSVIAKNGEVGKPMHVINKPYRRKDLLAKVGSLLDGSSN